MKACTKCRILKPADEFARKTDAKDGRHPHCKACDNARRRALRDNNIGAERAKDNARYTVRRDAKRAYDRQYYQQHASRIKEGARAYADVHRERLRPTNRQRAMKYAAQKRQAVPAWSDSARIKEFYFAADFLGMVTGEWYHVDHIVPLQSSQVCGLHVEHNLQVIPGSDNQSKGNRIWPDQP